MKEPQTNADGPSRGLLRPCFARLLALLVGQPDAFGAGASRDGHSQLSHRIKKSGACEKSEWKMTF